MVYSYTAVYRGKQVWKIRSLVYFHSFESLDDALEVQTFQGLFFTPSQRH